MSDSAFEAIRARERAEAERDKLAAEARKAALSAFVDFCSGRATLQITPPRSSYVAEGAPWIIRFIRDPKPPETKPQ